MSVQLIHCGEVEKAPLPVQFTWNQLTSIPDSTGFAGSFAGICEDGLLVAGGANFPNGGTPWNGGKKRWYDTIYLYDAKAKHWLPTGKLPAPAGYGVSVQTEQGLIIIGGSNDTGHLNTVYRINSSNKKLSFQELPSLPVPLANSCGALVGNKIYIAGGQVSPSSLSTSSLFLSFDLNNSGAGWVEEQSWPGPSRMLAVAGSDGCAFYLFSGTELVNGQRVYLKDAYRFSPDTGWKVLTSLPKPVVAAASPAAYIPGKGLHIFGGDDGALAPRAAELKEKHPGFSNEIWSYNPVFGSWMQNGTIQNQLPVTTTMVEWKGEFILPGGEVKPGIRTTQVLIATPSDER